jgi:hypothetical protein
MNRLFLVFVITAVTVTPTAAQTIYVLNPVGTGSTGDVLGNNVATSASDFYDVMKSKWKIPTVEPIYKNGIVDNVEDLIPANVFVVPELVSVRMTQTSGSQFDYNRQNHTVASPMPVTVNPAEDSVFVYAMNKDGKLIYPFVRSNTGDGKDYGSAYSIRVFKEHSNFSAFSQPFVVSSDVDILGTYDKDQPGMNPPNALMFRGRTPGRYSVSLAVRFNDQFLSVSTPDAVKTKALNTVIMKTLEIEVLSGPETIDGLLFNASKSQGMHESSKTLNIGIKEGEDLEVSLSGRKTRKRWNSDLKAYRDDGTVNLMLKEMTWSYTNVIQKPNSPFDADLIYIRKLTGDGTSVRITANKLPAGTEGKGTIAIEGHGRRFEVNVTVRK